MSAIIIDEIPLGHGLINQADFTVNETGAHHGEEEEEAWLYGNNKPKNDENIDNLTARSIDEVTTQEIDAREKAPMTSVIDNQFNEVDSDDDDDGLQVIIGNYEPDALTYQTTRAKGRGMLTGGPVVPTKAAAIRGVDFDAQGVINGQPTYEHDVVNAYKDGEKPWKNQVKKRLLSKDISLFLRVFDGADIADYFNYGFTEETWAQYSERQRRLRSENSLSRLNPGHIPPMHGMFPGHSPMVHPMMKINNPHNLPMMTRPMSIRKPDGRIDVIGTTDQTSRRHMYEPGNSFEHPSYMNGPLFPAGQSPNAPTVGDLISTSAATNGPLPSHSTSSGNTHHIPTLGVQRLSMMPLQHGMLFRPRFGHLHPSGAPQYLPRGLSTVMRGDRPPPPYFLSQYPQQLWDKTGAPPLQNFPPGSFPLQATGPATNDTGRPPYSRSPTPEQHSSRSLTPDETRPSGEGSTTTGDNDKSSKDGRQKERYKDDRDHHSSSRHRLSSKDRSSSSSSHHTHHRSSEHGYERPRDRDDKYDRSSRKRHHRDDNDSSRTHRSSHRTPTRTEVSQVENEQSQTSEPDQRSSLGNPLRHDDSERSSSRHSHHKIFSKRSRHDSGNERSSSHHQHRRSNEKSTSSHTKID